MNQARTGTKTQRWMHMLLWAFPQAHRKKYGADMLAAIADQPQLSRAQLLRESASLLWHGLGVRFRESRSLGTRQHLLWGTAAWYGLLVGLIPVGVLMRDFSVLRLLAICLLLLVPATASRSSLAALVLGCGGVWLVAATPLHPSVSVLEALPYQGRWLLPLVIVLVLAVPRSASVAKIRGATLRATAMGLSAGTLVVVPLFSAPNFGYGQFYTENYGVMVQELAFHFRSPTGLAIVAVAAMLWARAIRTLAGRWLVPVAHLMFVSVLAGTTENATVLLMAVLLLVGVLGLEQLLAKRRVSNPSS